MRSAPLWITIKWALIAFIVILAAFVVYSNLPWHVQRMIADTLTRFTSWARGILLPKFRRPRFHFRRKKATPPSPPQWQVVVPAAPIQPPVGGTQPPQVDPQPPTPKRGWLVILLFSLISVVYVSIIWLGRKYTQDDGVNWQIVGFVAITCHFAGSFRVVSAQEQAILILWGIILRRLGSGPKFAPWPMYIIRAPKTSIKVDFGTLSSDDAARIRQSADSITWYVMEEPIRINFGDINSTTSDQLSDDERKRFLNDPYSNRLTTDPHLYFIFRVNDLWRMWEEVGGVEEAIDRIKDTCVTALSEEAGQTFVARAVTQIKEMSKILLERVEDLVGDPEARLRARLAGTKEPRSWGVDILEGRIKDLGTPRRTNEATADRAASVARADGEATAAKLRAEGEKQRIISTSEGDKQRIINIGDGEAAAIAARGKALEDSPGAQLALRVDAFQAGLEKGRVVLMPADMSLMSGVLAAKEAMDTLAGGNKPPVGGRTQPNPPSQSNT